MTLRKTMATAIAVAALGCFGISNALAAATAPAITYTASGTFASTATSGADTLRLAGEPFSVSIAVSSSTQPFKHGSNWAAYNKLKLTGTVHSGLLGTTPVTIASSESTIIQGIDPGQYDQFTMEAPIKVVGISLTIKAVITMPSGTIGKPTLGPFSAITLVPANSTVTYQDSSSSTVLAVASGTLTATVPSGAGTASPVLLHAGGVRAVTLNGDGTESARSIGTAGVEIPADAVTLKFYASGVRGASDVRVQIGGDEVPVLYASASGYFPGLDEVMVQAPRSLAGRGVTEVTLTADGQTADPVRIYFQ
ncbi:MAG: hypothetical protein ABSF64_16210 [Bryobacteraceae bacterium]|jgi:hypothetical protein